MTDTLPLRQEMATYFNKDKERIKGQWIRAMKAKGLFDKMRGKESQTEPDRMYDICIEYLESGFLKRVDEYARAMTRKAVLAGMSSGQIMIMFHALRDVLGRALFEKYNGNPAGYIAMMDVYEPGVNTLLRMAYDTFICERDRIIREEQAALHESEALYHTLTENIADGIALLDGDRFLFVNSAFVSMFGYASQRQLLGKRVTELIAGDFQGEFRAVAESLVKGMIKEKILRCKCIGSDERAFWVEVHPIAIQWKGKTAILATLAEITEIVLREMAEKEEADSLRKENARLKATMKERYKLGNIIGKSVPMQEVYELILKAAASNANVIIYGETGTGKELVARAIHGMSSRCKGPFVPVNSAAIPEHLLESEFFGYRKGSFTGAGRDKPGRLQAANGGVLFMDEIGEISIKIQAKLLRAFELGEFTPIGGQKAGRSDFRIIAATSRDLLGLVREGLMREDFFFRIHIITIKLPPLRERMEDIPLLVDHFFRLHNKDRKRKMIPGKIIEAFYHYDWPGNVRELQNVLQRYLAIGDISFLGRLIPAGDEQSDVYGNGPDNRAVKLKTAVERLEKRLIFSALEKTGWHRSNTAKLLGISRKTLFRKMNAWMLSGPETRSTGRLSEK